MLRFVLASVLLVAAVIAAPALDERIVGGTNATLGEYPYIVSLKKPTSHSCGGSIISKDYILTAAHCIAGSENNPGSLRIQYGIVDITSTENIVRVKKVIRNENYKPGGGYENDVAVLELEKELVFSENVQPIALPEEDDYPGNNASATLVGWGLDATSWTPLDNLQKVQIILFTNEFCKSKENDYNPNAHVCAGIPQGGKGQCNGDSGGPLTVNGKQYGVVSWSVKPCSSLGHPGIFAKVSQYRGWIREQTGI